MIVVKVSIRCGRFVEKNHLLESEDFTEIKEELLKRFGNITGSRKGEAERQKIKSIIKSSNNLKEIEQRVDQTHWEIKFDSYSK